MTYPSSDVNTTNADASIDNPATFRTDVLDLITKFNLLRNHIPTFMQTLLGRTSAALARADLGVAPRATRIDVASVAGVVDLTANAPDTDDIRLTGAPTVTGFTVAIGRDIRVVAGGASTLTNNANIVTQTGANIVCEAGDNYVLRAIAANVVEVLSFTKAVAPSSVQIQPISASVGANALTISASALSLDFRSGTLASGAVTKVSGTPANLVISSGSTLGTASAVKSRIAVLVLNNAGTLELAAINLSGGVDLSETGVISTTAEGGAGAADSPAVAYSTAARSSLAYRVIGYVESTQAAAGTWATAPSTIQGYGGQALAALSSLGYGQNWQVVTRTSGTAYYNDTGRPIVLNVLPTTGTGGGVSTIAVNGVTVAGWIATASAQYFTQSVIIPVGASYVVTDAAGGTHNAVELR